MQVFIEGRLKPPRVYTDRNGTARCDAEIVASTMLMLGGRGEGASDYAGHEDSYGEHNDSPAAPAPARPAAPAPARPTGNSEVTRNQPESIPEDEDEIPF
jgi:single-stranded DNA-binding protein